MEFCFHGEISGLLPGIQELCTDYAFSIKKDGLPVEVVQKPGSPLLVEFQGKAAVITYDRKIHFFRALGLLIERLREQSTPFSLKEVPQFTMNGPMLDVSQGNAAPNVQSVRQLLRHMAVMGLDMLMLYSEDSYKVKEQPYFGYLRARYTEEELRDGRHQCRRHRRRRIFGGVSGGRFPSDADGIGDGRPRSRDASAARGPRVARGRADSWRFL